MGWRYCVLAHGWAYDAGDLTMTQRLSFAVVQKPGASRCHGRSVLIDAS